MFRKERVIKLLFILALVFVILNSLLHHVENVNKRLKCELVYKTKCLDLFKQLRYPNKSLIFKPPTSRIPEHLLNQFTQNGLMPLKRNAYINEAFDETNPFFKYIDSQVSMDEVSKWRYKVRKDDALGYTSFLFEKVMRKYEDMVAKESLLVVGTKQPWIEALALELNAVDITTLDYAKKQFEQPNLKWYQYNDYLDYLISNKVYEQFTNAASYSFIEHVGLGRYGEALSPTGDIDTLKQIQCLVRPGGLLFLGVQTSPGLNESYIEFNYHRVYGMQRLSVLIDNDWEVLFNQREDHTRHSLFVLRKRLEKTCSSTQ